MAKLFEDIQQMFYGVSLNEAEEAIDVMYQAGDLSDEDMEELEEIKELDEAGLIRGAIDRRNARKDADLKRKNAIKDAKTASKVANINRKTAMKDAKTSKKIGKTTRKYGNSNANFATRKTI